MDEEKISEKTEGQGSEETVEDLTKEVSGVSKSSASENRIPDPIEEARIIAGRIEKANIEHKKLLDRQEKMIAENMLHGRASAGGISKKELSDEEYSRELMEGKIQMKTGD